MRRISPPLSRLTREPGANSSQQPSLCLPVQKVLHAGNNAENIVHSKASQLLHYRAREFGNMHHGSRESGISGQSEKKQTSILLAKWTCPPKFNLNERWFVAAGEESKEVRVQEEREAFLNQLNYPDPFDIPHSPTVSFGEDLDHDEITRIIPIEPVFDSSSDEEATSPIKNSMASASELDASKPCAGAKGPVAALTGLDADVGAAASELYASKPCAGAKGPVAALTGLDDVGAAASELDASKPCTGAKGPIAALTGLDADVGAAASVAFTALMKSYEQGNLIDTDLLIKLLNDPKMIELLKNTPLANSYSIQPSSNTPSCVTRNPVDESSSVLPTSVSDTAVPSVSFSHSTCPIMTSFADISIPKPPASSATIFARPPTFQQKSVSTDSVSLSIDKRSSSVKALQPPLKDVGYLKSLVRQHGVERPEVEGPQRKRKTSSSSPSPRESRNVMRRPEGQGNKKPKASSKPCKYFGGPKGCRLGLSCPFRHDLPNRQPHSGSVAAASGFKRVIL